MSPSAPAIVRIVMVIPPCYEIDAACRDAINAAKEFDCIAEFEFNGVKVEAFQDSDPRGLAEAQHLEAHRQATEQWRRHREGSSPDHK